MSAHLAHVKNRFCQRVARLRICKGWINSRMTRPLVSKKNSSRMTRPLVSKKKGNTGWTFSDFLLIMLIIKQTGNNMTIAQKLNFSGFPQKKCWKFPVWWRHQFCREWYSSCHMQPQKAATTKSREKIFVFGMNFNQAWNPYRWHICACVRMRVIIRYMNEGNKYKKHLKNTWKMRGYGYLGKY